MGPFLKTKQLNVLILLVHVTVYGWVDNFPKKVSRGDVLNLKVGYLKGIPDIRRTVTVIFNNTGKYACTFNVLYSTMHSNSFYSAEVNVNATSFVLLRTPTNVMVTVLGDRPPVSENVTITLTLQYDNVGSDDIFLDTAQLVIPQGT